jgi:hypothetical protein
VICPCRLPATLACAEMLIGIKRRWQINVAEGKRVFIAID